MANIKNEEEMLISSRGSWTGQDNSIKLVDGGIIDVNSSVLLLSLSMPLSSVFICLCCESGSYHVCVFSLSFVISQA